MSDRETFVLGARRFDVTLAKQILSSEGPAEVLERPVAELYRLLGFIGVWPKVADALPDEALDVPIIAVTDTDGCTVGRARMVIDGYHRIHAAQHRGRETLTMHVLDADQSGRVELPRLW